MHRRLLRGRKSGIDISFSRSAQISWICAGPPLAAPLAPPLARSARQGGGSSADPRNPRGAPT
eukprot:6911060-Pyramimonas_sp.AAC.1